MADGQIDLAHCRILISNDDGIASPGIRALERIARAMQIRCLSPPLSVTPRSPLGVS